MRGLLRVRPFRYVEAVERYRGYVYPQKLSSSRQWTVCTGILTGTFISTVVGVGQNSFPMTTGTRTQIHTIKSLLYFLQ
jgi:hypothetical protein